MESVVRALVVWVRANLLLLLTLAGVVVGVILGAVLSWRLIKLHEYKHKGDHRHPSYHNFRKEILSQKSTALY